MLFNPSPADVRRFFCTVYAKARAGQPLQPIETLASLWIDEHPQYHAELADLDAALRRLTTDAAGAPATDSGAFLHLSLHVAISEQCSIDQPRGIRQAVELLSHRLDGLHDAHHQAMDCLQEMLFDAQRYRRAPDGDAYVAAVQRRATRD
ncbi:MAG: DUF1841 family protein [Rhodoferax sp.]